MSDPFISTDVGVPLDNMAHVIQVALTPVFLLSGVGTLLNVFNARLARVTDHAEHAAELLGNALGEQEARQLRAHLRRLQQRTVALDASVALMAVAGAATCGAAFGLFPGALRDAAVASSLTVLFGIALLCTVGALTAFLADSVLAWHGLRSEGPLLRSNSLRSWRAYMSLIQHHRCELQSSGGSSLERVTMLPLWKAVAEELVSISSGPAQASVSECRGQPIRDGKSVSCLCLAAVCFNGAMAACGG